MGGSRLSVRVVGTNLDLVRQHATKIAGEMRRIPFLRDVQFQQTLDRVASVLRDRFGWT